MNIRQIEQSFQTDSDGKCSVSSNGMVATAFPAATHAGVEMLRRGGNAVDAACASALALCVCEPQASGLGGHTMVMLGVGKKNIFLNGSGRIPLNLNADLLEPADLQWGYRATTVPTTIAVLGHMNRYYGTLEWRDIFGPAIDIAHNGYRITPLQHALQKKTSDTFCQSGSAAGRSYFLKNGTTPYESGDLFKQKDLALVLERLARKGVHEFYTGDIAHAIAEDMADHQGFLTMDDLARIPWPSETTPLMLRQHGLTIHVPPPPSPGRGLLMMLGIVDRVMNSHDRHHLSREMILAEITRFTLTALAASPLQPGSYNPGHDPLLKASYFDRVAGNILTLENPGISREVPVPKGGETTHLSVMDKHGNSVGLTQSINLVYGAKAAARGLGFLYNNYLVDCNRSDPLHPHFLKPSGLPVSMVCPTIISHNDRPWMVTGSPGSDRILSAVFQFLYNVIYSNQSIDIAMTQPRLHCPPSGRIMIESDRFSLDSVHALKNHGYTLDWHDPWSFYHGAIHTTLMCHEQKGFQGVAEIRRDGIAAGVD